MEHSKRKLPPAISAIIARGRADTLSVILVALMFFVGVIYYFFLPSEITAYPGAGEMGRASKLFGLFAIPLAGALLYLVLTFIPPLIVPRRKRFPESTAKYIRPAALAYFAYAQVSIIAFNKAQVSFSPAQNLSVIIGIGVLYAAAQISGSKSNLVPKILRGASVHEAVSFNSKFAKSLGHSSAVVFAGFFAGKYLWALLILEALTVISLVVYYAYGMKKKDELRDIKNGVELPEKGKNAP